jgi:hypothetical protein
LNRDTGGTLTHLLQKKEKGSSSTKQQQRVYDAGMIVVEPILCILYIFTFVSRDTTIDALRVG